MANFTLTEGIHAMTTCKWYDKTWERHLKKHIEDYELFSQATELTGAEFGRDSPEYSEAVHLDNPEAAP